MKAPPPVESTRGPVFQQPLDHSRLKRPELRFAIRFEQFRDRHPGYPLDLVIGIHKGYAEHLRHQPADGRFARAHQADENQIALAKHAPRLLDILFRRDSLRLRQLSPPPSGHWYGPLLDKSGGASSTAGFVVQA
jgi:hypothetical protein